MAENVQGRLSIAMDLDSVSFQNSLKGLRREVRNTMTDMRGELQTAQLLGDKFAAADVKVSHLSDALSEQSELLGKHKSSIISAKMELQSFYKANEENIQSNSKLRQQYNALTKNVDKQSKALSREEGYLKQLTRQYAKATANQIQYKYGIEKVEQSHQKLQKVMQNEIATYKASGKEYLANGRQHTLLKSQLAHTTDEIERNRKAARSLKEQYASSSAQIPKLQEQLKGYANKEKDLVAQTARLGDATEKDRTKKVALRKELENNNQAMTKASVKLAEYQAKQEVTNRLSADTKVKLSALTAARAKETEQLFQHELGLKRAETHQKALNAENSSAVQSLAVIGKNYQANSLAVKTLSVRQANLLKQYELQTAELDHVRKASGENSDAYATEAAKLNHLKIKLSETNLEMKNVSKFSFKTKGLNSAADWASKYRDGLNHVGSALIGIGKAGAIATAGLIGFAVKGVQANADLQQSFNRTRNLVKYSNGESAKEVTTNMAKLKSETRGLSDTYGEQQQTLATGFQELIKRGYSSTQALASYRNMEKASVATGDSFNDVIQSSAGVLEAFGLRAQTTGAMTRNTSRALNAMSYVADLSATSFKEMSVSMEYAGASAKSAGQSLENTSAAIGVLSNHGLQAQQSGTGMRKIFNSLISPTVNATKAMQDYGIKMSDLKDKSGNLKPLPALFDAIHEKTKNLTKLQRTDLFHRIFGTTGQNAALILADNTRNLAELSKQASIGEKHNYINKLAAHNMNTFAAQLKIFKANLKTLEMDLGTTFMPLINKGLKVVISFVKKINKWPESLKESRIKTLLWIGGLTSALTIVGGITSHLSSIFGLVGKISSFLTGKSFSLWREGKAVESLTAKYQVLNSARAGNNQTFNDGSISTVEGEIGNKHKTSNALSDVEAATSGRSAARSYEHALTKEMVTNSKGKVKWSALFKHGTRAAEVSGGTSGLRFGRKLVAKIGDSRVATHSAFSRLFSAGKSAGAKAGLSSAASFGSKLIGGIGKFVSWVGIAAAIFQPLYQAVSSKNSKSRYDGVARTIGGGLGAAIGFSIGGAPGAALFAWFGSMIGGLLPKLWKYGRDMADSLIKGYHDTIKAMPGIIKNTKSFLGGLNKYAKQKTELSALNSPEAKLVSGKERAYIAKRKKALKKEISKGQNNYWGAWGKWINSDYDAEHKHRKSHKSASNPLASASYAKVTAKDVLSKAGSVSKSSIRGIKDMTRALKTYGKELQDLRRVVSGKAGKAVNTMYKELTSGKNWNKVGSGLQKVSRAFEYLAAFAKYMKGQDPFKKLISDLPKLNRTIASQKGGLTKHLHELNKALIGKSKGDKESLVTRLKTLSSKFDSLATHVKKANDKLSKTASYFKDISKLTSQFKHKNKNPFTYLSSSIITLRKSLAKVTTGKNSIQNLLSKLKSGIDKLVSNKGGKNSGLFGALKKSQTQLTDFNKAFATFSKNITKKYSKLGSNLNTKSKTMWGKITKTSVKAGPTAMLNKIDSFAKTFKRKWYDLLNSITKKYNTLGSDLNTKSKRMWNNITNTSVKNGPTAMLNKTDGFIKTFKGKWSDWLKSITKSLKTAFNKLPSLVETAMKHVTKNINKGISGVNGVVREFGGTDGALVPMRYATGTGFLSGHRRAISKPTLALLNDGNDSPETGNKEAVYYPQKNQLSIVNGKNVPQWLMPGAEVLNATEAKILGLTHFASGTGYLKQLYEQFKAYHKKPTNTLKKMMNYANHSHEGQLELLTKGMFNKSDKPANTWWSQLWSMADDKINGGLGDASGLLKAVEQYGHGKPYVWGAAGPSEFDCSGLIKYALEKSFGIVVNHYSGSQYDEMQHVSDPKAGDVVFFGPGGSEHEGVYAGHGMYYSAQSPSSSPNIGMAPVSAGPSSIVHYARPNGVHSSDSDNSKVKTHNALQKLIKGQVGKGFWQTIGKIAEKYGETPGNVGGSAKAWTSFIKQAADRMHTSLSGTDLSKIISMIQGESGGNATVTQTVSDINSANGDPAQGLLQFIPETFAHYSVSGHGNIKKGYDQLLALFNDANWRNDIHFGGGWGPTGMRRFADGGMTKRPAIFGDEGDEMAIPLSTTKRDRANYLLNQTDEIINGKHQSVDGLADKLNTLITLTTTMVNALQEVAKNSNNGVQVAIDGQEIYQTNKKYHKLESLKNGILY